MAIDRPFGAIPNLSEGLCTNPTEPRTVYSAAIDAGVRLLVQYGLFVAAIIAIRTDTIGIASVVLVAVVGATLGQITLFVLIRRTKLTVDALPGAAGPAPEGRFDSWFDRWGVSAVALSNTLPIARTRCPSGEGGLF